MGRAAMAGTATGTATACWTSLGFLVHLTVTEPETLAPARELLEADLAALDAACSRFRPDSELAGLDRTAGQPVQVSPRPATTVTSRWCRRTGPRSTWPSGPCPAGTRSGWTGPPAR